jgi:phosphoribosylglycinamide formyltransferase 1
MNIAIFASGGGSNAAVIIKKLPQLLKAKNALANIGLILTNNPNAAVLQIALENNIPAVIIDINKKTAEEVDTIYLSTLQEHQIDFIVLAGYLKKIPAVLTKKFSQKIINIHPALLPSYGGAGMYGVYVHKAVVAAGEKQSGITIHFVDEVYDHGAIIFQQSCKLDEDETSESLAKKVLLLEHEWYATIICNIIISQNDVK